MRIRIQVQNTGHTGIVKHMLHFKILGCGHRQKVAVILLQGYVRELYLGTTLRGNYPQYTALCSTHDLPYKVMQSAVKYVMPLSPILIESLCNLTCSLLNTKAPIVVTVSIIVTKCSPQPELKTSSCLPLTSAVDDQCIQSHCFVKQLCLQSHAVLYSFSHCRCSCSHISLRGLIRPIPSHPVPSCSNSLAM